MAAQRSSTGILDEDDEVAAIIATPEEAWAMFEQDVREILGIPAEQFLARAQSGEFKNDDSDSALTYLFHQLPYLPQDKLNP